MADDATLRDAMARQQKPIEQLDAEHANDAPGGMIPVTWSDGAGTKLRGRPLTVLPNDAEVATFGSQRAATCGQCKNYDLEGGRKQIVRQRFLERVVREEGWKPHHLGDIDSLGLCRENPRMAVTYISGACDSFRPRRRA